ncbi:MAG: hypothetical protein KY392_00035 [Chloroflexi bacterium]|nr:hypothetical protein [Chloroflexota bacterium]
MRALGWLINVALRAWIVAVIVEALRRPEDPRYRGKAIGTRGSVMIPASLLFPLAQLLPGRRRRPYPLGTDSLYLSIFALDLAGNHFNLYDRYLYFDAIPHAHGTGAFTVAAAELLDLQPLSAVGVAQVVHILLEAQEYYSDVLFDLRNVRGTWDTVNDLLAGTAGSIAYAAVLARRR